ncbi:hypothetical protein [Tomitella biformata]|uniref:hypothetical protein n=1 Tax=Tomitella biformata TaxID=630403 RepID=UPI0004BA10C0|nr:hypothetical protein [Tomitella biformata]
MSTMPLAESEFVVVVNSLPLDVEIHPDGQASWSRGPSVLIAAGRVPRHCRNA